MKKGILLLAWILIRSVDAAPQFNHSSPSLEGSYQLKGAALCATAKHTLMYLNRGPAYDPKVIHGGTVLPVSLEKVKATLIFICQHQYQLNDPNFIKQHFDFIRWSPDLAAARKISKNKRLLENLPKDRILMTKYYVHLAHASDKPTQSKSFALYALPEEERSLTLDQANAKSGLLRFKYGKQAILRGGLEREQVTKLAYLSRRDLEAALLQGTVVADFGSPIGKKIFNVHRNNNIGYDRAKLPEAQERYWYFKEVSGIKGYGKDAEYKITINPEVTFAADLAQFGLGKMMMIQYPDSAGRLITKAGIFADTGGAFVNNLFQVDYLAGSFPNREAFFNVSRHLPDYVAAYFMVLKDNG